MKYSGIEWIGEIPDNWGLRKVKQCFYISKEQAHDSNPTVLSLARAGVKIRDISNNEGQLAASYDNYNPVQPGDLLLNPMDLYSGANCSLSDVSGVISPAYVNLRKYVELNPKFFDYFFKTQYWTMAMFAHGKGVSFDNRWTMNAEAVLNYYLPFPSYEEQNRIVEKINQKTDEIDSLIEIENQQIEKLKEYKQAVITEAVTKGLDKNVAMKDSGVEWISKIPVGWSIQKVLNQLSMSVTDGPHTTPELQPEGVAFVSAEAVSCGNGVIDFSHIRGYISEEFYQECCLKYIPEIDDVYMIKSGATTGRVSIVTTLEPKFTIWSPLAVMRCDKNKMIPKFLYYAVQCEHFQRQVSLGWSFGTQQNLGMRTLEQLKLIIPTLLEQREIADYLDIKTGDIEKIIELKNKKIDRLGEYKKSLIYEYVTGKKEVTA